MPIIPNPFEQEENLQTWFEKDLDYKWSKKTGLNKYLKNRNLKKTTTMNFKNTYLNIIHLITKNAVVASIIMIMALTTFGASAAELFAPKEYKPSSLFVEEDDKKTETKNEDKKIEIEITDYQQCAKAGGTILEIYPEQCVWGSEIFTRKLTEDEKRALEEAAKEAEQKENEIEEDVQTNLAKPLVADAEHDVVVIDECDLAIKYAKNGRTNITFDKGLVNDLNTYLINDVFNIRCQKGKSFNDFLNQDVLTLPIPNIGDIETMQQTGIVKAAIKGKIGTLQIDADTQQEYYLDSNITPGAAVFRFKNSDINILMVGNKDNNLDDIVAVQQNSLAPSISSLNLEEESLAQNQSGENVYTNQYYPNLSINYSGVEGWNFTTDTLENDMFTNILNRRVVLAKGETKMEMYFSPIFVPSGCGGEGGLPSEVVNINKDLNRISTDVAFGPNYIYTVGENLDCMLDNQLETNLDINSVQEKPDLGYPYLDGFKDFHNRSGYSTVLYNFFISLETDNPEHLAEADQIIRQSVLR